MYNSTSQRTFEVKYLCMSIVPVNISHMSLFLNSSNIYERFYLGSETGAKALSNECKLIERIK